MGSYIQEFLFVIISTLPLNKYIYNFSMQDISIRSSSVIYVYPPENPKSTIYYVLQTLKGLLPKVVVKVLHKNTCVANS